MDRTELLTRLRGLEGIDFEVKAALGGVPDDAYKTVSAFANTQGGWLVFGVAEKRRAFAITGVADPDRMQNDFVRACRSGEKFSRPIDVMPRIFTVDGATVVCFRVVAASRSDKPIRVRSRKTWETYIRVGAGDHLCTLEEEARFLRDASFESFDGLPRPDLSLEDLSPRAIKWFRGVLTQRRPERAWPELEDAAWLAEVGLLREKGALTNAAVLLFGRDAAMARIKPAGILDFRVIEEQWSEGSPEQRWDDRELFEDNLVGTLRGVFDRINRRLPHPFALDGDEGRSAARSPDFVAMREALVNLLAHQDYADRNRTARVLWYRDRVLFENPGDSFVTLPQMLDGGVSQLRNPLLVRLLRQAGFAEQAGTGIVAIVRAWRAAKRPPPQMENDPGCKKFTLTLPWLPLASEEWTNWLHQQGIHSEATEAAVTGSPITGSSITGSRVTDSVVTGSHYEIVTAQPRGDEPVAGEPAEVLSPVMRAHAADLLQIIGHHPGVRVPGLITATGWSSATVRRVLAVLRARGDVIFEGAPRNGGYRAVGGHPGDRAHPRV